MSNANNRLNIIRDSLTLMLVLGILTAITSCQRQSSNSNESGLKVIATTSMVGDVVSNIGGDKISVDVLLPLGADPHSFSPTPQDAGEIADVDIVFANGVGLEEFLKPL